MATTSRLVTAEDLLKPEFNDRRVELIEGEVREMSPDNYFHGTILGDLTTILGSEIKKNKKGSLRLVAGGTGLILKREPDTVLAPDLIVADISFEKNHGKGFYEYPPIVAVEVLSPSNRRAEMLYKTSCYLDFGVQEVWIVNPRDKTLTIEKGGAAEEPRLTLMEEDQFEGKGPLEGITFPIREVFESLPKAE